MGKYSVEQKLEIIHMYLGSNESFKQIGDHYGINKSIIQRWVTRYQKHGSAAFTKAYTKYSTKFKLDVIQYILKTGASVEEATIQFNIPSFSTVWNWWNLFEVQGADALQVKKRERQVMKKEPKQTQHVKGSNEDLLAQNELLRIEVAYLKKLQGLNFGEKEVTEKEKAQIIYELRREFKVIDLIKIAGIARSTYYYWVKKFNCPDKYKEIKERISHIFEEHQGRYGYRRITLELQKQGYLINHKTVRRLMSILGLKSLIRIKKYRSYRGQAGRFAPNLLNRNFQASKPNQKWVTDVTEFHLQGQKLYLSPVLDLYNGEIIAYNIASRPTYSLVSKMLNSAFKRLNDGETPILHSDQGWQYQLKRYQNHLKEKGIIQSMSRKGNCYDNAVIENFFGLLKSELLYLKEFESMEHFKIELENYIHYYNHKRIKGKLKGMSPVQYRNHSLLVA
ncbi:IS3 family transposase [Bacillus cereus]|uniref:IS3 family transposase n=1 Tax=Bacillus cereus TaxID=1396 RepID=UPI003EDEB90C